MQIIYKMNESHLPKVSIIINCYNSEKYLRETIESVLNQTYNNYELIIYDDASTDSTESIALNYGNKLRYYKIENKVPLGHARNNALEKVTGDLITFLDHDDIIMPERLKKQVEIFSKNKEIALVFSNANIIDSNGKIIGKLISESVESKVSGLEYNIKKYSIPWLTVMIKKKMLDKIGNFNNNFMQIEDFDLVLRLILHYPFVYLPEILASYRWHSGNLTKSNLRISVLKELEKSYRSMLMSSNINPYIKLILIQEYLRTCKKIIYNKVLLK